MPKHPLEQSVDRQMQLHRRTLTRAHVPGGTSDVMHAYVMHVSALLQRRRH